MQNKDSKRTNATQLPSDTEVNVMLAKEAQRISPPEKKDDHYPEFSTAVKWGEFLGIDCTFLNTEITQKSLHEKSAQIQQQIANKTLEEIIQKNNTQLISVLQQVANYLGEEDPIEKSDIIIVYGGKSLLRAEKAVQLWEKGIASLLLCSGGHPHYDKTEPEAFKYKAYAIERGIPEDKILVEPNSITSADNVKSSLNLLEEKQIPHKTITQVTSWYAQRRSWAYMMKLSIPGTKILRVNSDPTEPFAYSNWYKSDATIKIVLNEFIKMKISMILNSA
jgi:hypothetical protein